ncbi:MAG TPA: TlpA disulfide reductase family protein [Gammaproteobacteria bacterium]|nr:TlpA disulfide reductase family protein [Gammaproteobacteria bacterium]
MASKARPVLLTALLSGAALAGYIAFRLFVGPAPDAPESAQTLRFGEDPAAPDEHDDDSAAQLADSLPEFSLDTLAGTQQSIASWPGKPLLINFWATWCGPCLHEIPMLKQLQTRRADLQVVGIAVDKRESVVGFAANMQFNYPILIGESGGWDAAAAFGVNVYALPFTVFTAPNGAVLGVHTGELHAEQLDNLAAVLDDLKAGKIDIATARARIAGRI